MSHHSSAIEQPDPPHVHLPLASIEVGAMGVVNATLDGTEFPHPVPGTSWSRAQFGELLDALTQERKRTIRIEVRESDGSTFTDIIRAKRAEEERLAETAVPTQPETRRASRSRTPQLVEVEADGFIPGEDITVAIVVSSAEGSSIGVGGDDRHRRSRRGVRRARIVGVQRAPVAPGHRRTL